MSDRESIRSGFDDSDLVKLIGLAGARTPIASDRAGRVRRAVEAEWRDSVARRRTRAYRTLLVAASIAAIGIAALLLREPLIKPVAVGSMEVSRGEISIDDGRLVSAGFPLMTGTELSTGSDGLAAMRMTNGASMRIASGTRLRFETPQRVRLTKGALYIDSPPTLTGSMQIVVGEMSVREIGTQFEVRAEDWSTVVRVREGRVAVEGARGRPEAARGEELTIAPDGSTERRRIETWGTSWEWMSNIAPPFEIEGRSLDEFLRWAERETGLTIDTGNVDPAFLSSTRLHGSIEGLTPSEAIEAVLPTTGLDWEIGDGRLIVTKPR